MKSLIIKTAVPEKAVRRFTALWAHQEFLNEKIVETYVEYIKKKQKFTIPPQDQGFNNERYRYRLFLDEGYRRFGGSARLVLKFVRHAAHELMFVLFDSVKDSQEWINGLRDESDIRDAIENISHNHTKESEKYVKVKALVYHRVPDDDLEEASVVIATNYMRRQIFSGYLMNSEKEIGKLIAALQATGRYQAP